MFVLKSQRPWGGDHAEVCCKTYPTARTRRSKLGRACHICFKPDHFIDTCSDQTTYCLYCLNRHHGALCYMEFPDSDRTESGNLAPESKSEPGILCPDFTVLETMELENQNHPRIRNNLTHDDDIHVAMQTAKSLVWTSQGNIELPVSILFDTGSKRSFITEAMADELSCVPKKRSMLSVATLNSSKDKRFPSALVDLELRLIDGSFLGITVNTIDKVTGTFFIDPISLSERDKRTLETVKHRLANEIYTSPKKFTIDLLIGNDLYPFLLNGMSVSLDCDVQFLNTKLGWVTTGMYKSSEMHQKDYYNLSTLSALLSQTRETTKEDLERLWSLESLGIKDPQYDEDDKNAQDFFDSTIRFEDNRCQTKWPYKIPNPNPSSNYQIARKRLSFLMNTLRSKPPSALQQFCDTFADYESKGIIEKVTPSSSQGPVIVYIPFHAVFTEWKATTKMRIVFDASAHSGKDSLSLNDCLYRGPVILSDLCGLLMRFRLYAIGIVSDIEKAFLQIGLQPPDRDVTRFLWLKDPSKPVTEDNIFIYRFCRVAFGMTSSPFLLGASVQWLLKRLDCPVARKIASNIYVDNVIVGVDTEQEAKDFYRTAKALFNEGSMNLCEWSSNSSGLINSLPEKDRAKGISIKVMGVPWDLERDTFSVPIPDSEKLLNADTKRSILKAIASVFDPLGLFSAITIKARIFLQELWKGEFDWDDLLTTVQLSRWKEISRTILEIGKMPLSRYLFPTSGKFDLICFSDASAEAYACLVYLRRTDDEGKISCSLVFAKARLCPKMSISIPRLELMGVLIGSRCLHFVETQLRLAVDNRFLFTDSQCVLKWIESKKTMRVFVKNRLNEIRSHENVTFRFVSTDQNPADLATRSKITNIPRDFWWSGPDWLKNHTGDWPSFNRPEISPELLQQIEKEISPTSVLFSTPNLALFSGEGQDSTPTSYPRIDQLIAAETSSDLLKLWRKTAWVLRFLAAIKKKRQFRTSVRASFSDVPPLSGAEIREAKLVWDHSAQLSHFQDSFVDPDGTDIGRSLGLYVDSKGLLRCHGRLGNSAIEKDPKLLPTESSYTNLVIQAFHFHLLHAGVSHTLNILRSEYWIPRGRSKVKKTLNQCMTCRKHKAYPFEAPVFAPLPKERITTVSPFAHIGVDLCGPFLCKQSKKGPLTKVFVCLFTCATIRAIHVEIVLDKSMDQFLLAFRCFIARRGKPSVIFSDNAKQFHATAKLLRESKIPSDSVIEWRFITERAPWQGGFYERMIGLLKTAMRKAIGRAFLTLPQFETILPEIESLINSCPLWPPSSDVDDPRSLSPGDFLVLNPKRDLLIQEDDPKDPEYLPSRNLRETVISSWRKGQFLLQSFWNIWKSRYLVELRNSHSYDQVKGPRLRTKRSPVLNEIVIIEDRQLPRGCWKLGKIAEIHPSPSDGSICSVTLKTAGGQTLVRSVTQIYPLEVDGLPEMETKEEELPSPEPAFCGLTSEVHGFSFITRTHKTEGFFAQNLDDTATHTQRLRSLSLETSSSQIIACTHSNTQSHLLQPPFTDGLNPSCSSFPSLSRLADSTSLLNIYALLDLSTSPWSQLLCLAGGCCGRRLVSEEDLMQSSLHHLRRRQNAE